MAVMSVWRGAMAARYRRVSEYERNVVRHARVTSRGAGARGGVADTRITSEAKRRVPAREVRWQAMNGGVNAHAAGETTTLTAYPLLLSVRQPFVQTTITKIATLSLLRKYVR